jgi:hypothetical protein
MHIGNDVYDWPYFSLANQTVIGLTDKEMYVVSSRLLPRYDEFIMVVNIVLIVWAQGHLPKGDVESLIAFQSWSNGSDRTSNDLQKNN